MKKFFLSVFNALIAIPYLMVFAFSKLASSSNKLVRILFWSLLLLLPLILLRRWLPLETNPFVSVLTFLLILGAILGVAWCIERWVLKGFWRVVFLVLLVIFLSVAIGFFILELPRPIKGPLIPLNARIAAIDWMVEKAPEADQKALRQTLEKQWQQWHDQYYQATQGNQIIPYEWLRALEQRSLITVLKNTTPFLSDDNLTPYRVLPGLKGTWNPDGMPIGLVKDVDKKTGQSWMGISCASCHTGQLSYKGKQYLIDGGPTLQDFTYTQDMLKALGNNLVPVVFAAKFDRFAQKVLGSSYGEAQKEALKSEMRQYLGAQFPAFFAEARKVYPTKEGYARVDALGRGANGQFSPLSSNNWKKANAPVSYPPVWYTDEFDWVQSVAGIQQPMGRNMTEAWGVNARIYFDKYRRFQTTLKPENLFWIETYLSLTEPPDWPEDVFGKIDREKFERGRYLYEEKTWEGAPLPELEKDKLFEGKEEFYKVVSPPVQRGLCARCHQPQWSELTDFSIKKWGEQYENADKWAQHQQTSEGMELVNGFKRMRFVKLKMFGLDLLGTDPTTAVNFNARQTSFYQIATAGKNTSLADFFGKDQVGVAEALGGITLEAKKTVYDKDLELTLAQKAEWDGFRPNQFRAPLGYPARPLRGYWATAPYLHNGSVPNMYELLSPASERSSAFYVGNTEYDPKYMGYVSSSGKGFFRFNTQIEGNSNRGHEFRDVKPGESFAGVVGPRLSEKERLDIIEYLKGMRDITYRPNKPVPPQRGDYPSDQAYANAEKEYKWQQDYYDFIAKEVERRWKVLESMTLNQEKTLFELKKGG